MKITDIKQQQKRQGRYSIFVDDKYSFSLSENELLNSGTRVGREYSAEEFEQLKQTALLDKAYMRSLDLLSRRARSDWEMRQYLKRKEYDQDVIDKIVYKLAQKGYINDKKFADSWINSRRQLKNMSKRKLRLELKQKRVPEEIVNLTLDEDETNEQDVLRELVAKKRQQSKYQDNLKLMQYLSRQGFNYDDIKSALNAED